MKNDTLRFRLIVLLVALFVWVSIGMFAQGQPSGLGNTSLFFVRGLFTRNMPMDSYQAQSDINSRADLMVAQTLPERAEIVRMGNSWVVMDTTGVASVTAVPTTTASNTFWNGEPDGGKTYLVDRVMCLVTTAVGAASGRGILGVLNKGPVAAPTAVSLTVSSLNGRNYGGKIVVARSATVTDDKWWPLPGASNAGAANWPLAAGSDVGAVLQSDINGVIQIPPRHAFSVAIMAVNTTLVARCGLMWHEVQQPVVY